MTAAAATAPVVNFGPGLSQLTSTLTNDFASYWPVIAGVVGVVIALAILLRALERWTRDTFGKSFFLDDDEYAELLEQEAIGDRLDLLDAYDDIEIEEWNQTMIEESSVWHVGWDELDDADEWEWEDAA